MPRWFSSRSRTELSFSKSSESELIGLPQPSGRPPIFSQVLHVNALTHRVLRPSAGTRVFSVARFYVPVFCCAELSLPLKSVE